MCQVKVWMGPGAFFLENVDCFMSQLRTNDVDISWDDIIFRPVCAGV